MNYFSPKTAAERYAKGRPDFHENTINKIREFLHLDQKVEKALDIACGTGLSTKALLRIANNVYGTDASEEMLGWTSEKDQIDYSISLAEKQPFGDEQFNLITVCSGVHWFNIIEFLKEANRLLKQKSWLVLYDNYFLGSMHVAPHFTNWYQQKYLTKFPAPARNDQFDWSNKNLNKMNFQLLDEIKFENVIHFTRDELILYFTTQSNIISAVTENKLSYEEAENWLANELSVFYNNNTLHKEIYYGNWVKFLQKTT